MDERPPPAARACGALLEIEQLSKQFHLYERGRVLPACGEVSLRIWLGQVVALVGASGSGKSSILKCVYRTYLPTSGRIWYLTREGRRVDLASAAEADLLELRRREIRFVSQFLHVVPRQSARDVVARPLLEIGTGRDASRRRAEEMLQRVGLPAHLWDIPPQTFSGGERQLVNLARALIVRPRLLLLDEPTASLDPFSTDQVLRVIREVKNEEMAVLSVFHNRKLVAQLADQTLTLAGGVRWEPAADEAGNG